MLAIPLGDENSEASYIQANYVKFLELGGARVIPIYYNKLQDLEWRLP